LKKLQEQKEESDALAKEKLQKALRERDSLKEVILLQSIP
jgi:hypothetical protein